MSGGGHHEEDGLPEEHEEHVNHEAWVIPYADMLTLLMALFMMLFAMSTIDLAKFEKLAVGMADALGSGGSSKVLEGGPAILEGAGAGAVDPVNHAEMAEQALKEAQAHDKAVAAAEKTMATVEEQLRIAVPAAVRESIVVRKEARGIVVSIVADQVLFTPGGATLQPRGHEILREMAGTFASLPNQLTIEGHTDNVPINTPQFRSNWELSTARATEVLRVLVDELGVPANRVAAAGYGEQRPVASNDTAEGRARNRRVELAVLSEVPSS
jgi:chemotaxis protein MotB